MTNRLAVLYEAEEVLRRVVFRFAGSAPEPLMKEIRMGLIAIIELKEREASGSDEAQEERSPGS